MSLRDPATQLPSEELFMDRLGQALALARRKRARIGILQLAIHGGNLDDLELLNSLARRIEAQLRTTDSISRVGGQDFTILLNDIDSRPAARAVAEELCMALARPLELGGESRHFTVSYGLSLFPDDADDDQGLLESASKALGSQEAAHA